MQRRRAAGFYYFDRPFFERLTGVLPGQYAFFHVVKGSELLASELVLVSTRFVYSFLGGSNYSHSELRPNDLLKHSAVEWSHNTGRKAFVLGGGSDPRDGILRYKLSFSPNGAIPFCTSAWCLDDEAVGQLVAKRAEAERKKGRKWTPTGSFFPPYRG